MKISTFKKKIKGVFKQPKSSIKIVNKKTARFFSFYGCNPFIFRFKILDKQENYTPIDLNSFRINLFNKILYIGISTPIKYSKIDIVWKDKFNSPRYEFGPFSHLYFFGLIFEKSYSVPVDFEDSYYEQALWYIFYADQDLKKAEKTWMWVDSETECSTWNKEILINN